MECFAKAQVPQNIHGEVVAPIGHILGDSPAFALVTSTQANLLAESSDVGQDVSFHLLHGAVAERVADHASLARVQNLVSRIMCIRRRVHECIVEFCLSNVGSETVYLLEGGVRVEGDAVGSETHDAAVALVLTPELKVSVSFPCVVELIRICNFC